jgi:hypothetical protein
MFAVWAELPDDPEAAFKTLRSLSERQLRESYMAVYSGQATRIGWWDAFVLDGVGSVSRTFVAAKLAAFRDKWDGLKAYPLVRDGMGDNALSLNKVSELGLLLADMGAGLLPRTAPKEGEKAPELGQIHDALYPILFRGEAAETWAQTVGAFAIAAANSQKPLLWTLSQPPVQVQESLAAGLSADNAASGRLQALSRYRFVEVTSGIRAPQRFNTYTAQNLTLAQGRAEDAGITLKLYRTSEDSRPAVEYSIEDPWTIIALYMQPDMITGANGQTYVPIYFEDGQGRYVYFVEITFNAPLPPPASWYTTLDWPDLQVGDDAVSGG